MFNWFNNLKIRNKLIGAFLVMISLTIVVSVVAIFSQNHARTTVIKLTEVEGRIARLSLQSQNAMLMARRREKDYLLRYKQLGFEKARTQYVNQVQTSVATIHEYMAEIRTLETHKKNLALIETIVQAITEYETTFLAVVDLFEKRGFKDSGLEGQFRKRVHTIEAAIKAQNLEQLTIDLLTMRRHEKDYLLRTEGKYITRLHETVTQFKAHVAATDLNSADKEQLTTLANQYQTRFDELVQIDKQIATGIESYRAAVHRLTPLLEQIQTSALAYESEAQENIQRVAKATMITVISTGLVAVIVGWLTAVFLAGLVSKPLMLIVNGAKLLTAGNTALTGIDPAEVSQINTRQDEMGDIGRAFEALASYFKDVIGDIVRVSQGLVEGELHVIPTAEYRGDFVQIKDALEAALSDLRQVIEDIVQVSQGLAEGHTKVMPAGEYRGDFVQIKNALETAVVKLAEATTKNATQDWLKTGQTQLNEQMSGEQDMMTLAKNIIAFLTTRLKAQVGIFYLVEELNRQSQSYRLKMLANYAHTQHKNVATAFQFSEGMVGQAALEKQRILFTIDSGLGETMPRYFVAIPFLYEDVVIGVIELGFLEATTETQQEFINQIMSSVGIAVNTAESRTQMQELLQQTQAQSEELQSQQAELQQSNEELQSQSEELQTQQEELESQAEEMRHTNEELAERTRELERQKEDIRQKNQALEQSQKSIQAKAEELELASQYKSEFLANMSHELRTPLNSLLILAQLLANNKTGNLTEKQVEYAQTVHSAGSDLLTLINDILDLSKVEAGKMEIHLEDVSLADLMETVEQKFRPLAVEKKLAFSITVAENVPPVLHTDAQRLKQIINNLLSNAFKFTQQGEIKVEFRNSGVIGFGNSSVHEVGNSELPNVLAISVIDTGIGIPEEKQKVIFEAFQQVDGTTSRRFGGTGLGLSISRQLARLLGGEIQLSSEESKGSRFTLYLPETLSVPAKASTQIPPNTPKPKGGTPSVAEIMSNAGGNAGVEPLGGNVGVEPLGSKPVSEQEIADDRANLQPTDKSILIIEDDRKFSPILMELAQEKDFKCLVAEDGKTGLQLAEQYKPHAIILDVGLPQLDGWTVMDKLKDNPDTRHIPVHFISASDQSLDAKKMGAIGYLHKPVSMEQLGEAFNSIEQFITQTVKNLLVVVDCEPHQQQILDLVGSRDIQITLAVTTADACQHLQVTSFDCIILDVDIEQGSGIKLLEQMQKKEGLCQTPLIIYADHELTQSEEAILQRCAENFPVKSVKSQERLLDEATLFLHQLEANLPVEKRNMLRMVHDKATILRDKKVLIVDDDMRNAFALATVLEDEHEMEVVAGKNGKEALELLEEHQDIAIILMDIMMPEMDGYEAMQKIRQQLRFRKLPIIALTAKAMKGDKTKCIEAGANDYISKPVDAEKLISLMRVWLYR